MYAMYSVFYVSSIMQAFPGGSICNMDFMTLCIGLLKLNGCYKVIDSCDVIYIYVDWWMEALLMVMYIKGHKLLTLQYILKGEVVTISILCNLCMLCILYSMYLVLCILCILSFRCSTMIYLYN